MRQPKVWISAGILLLIALHAVPVLTAGIRKRTWPVLDWSMYKDSRGPGPIQVNKKRIIAITASGQQDTVTPDLLGSSPFALRNLYERPMWQGDSSAAQQLFARMNLERKDPVVEFRLESENYTVSDTGIVKQGNPVLRYHASPTPAK
ncbi:MAG TPA: hypothetical protein VGP44_06055 [Gemmatimonadales bacterium]|nr:hypothetical protein [Gemmatimonadales bacterium]